MFFRFVTSRIDEDSGRRLGMFQAAADLLDSGRLTPPEEERVDKIYNWFDANLQEPISFSRSRRPHAANRAISWFKDSAAEHLARMREMASILEDNGIWVEIVQTNRPGYIVYEDEFQVAAEPFAETVT